MRESSALWLDVTMRPLSCTCGLLPNEIVVCLMLMSSARDSGCFETPRGVIWILVKGALLRERVVG